VKKSMTAHSANTAGDDVYNNDRTVTHLAGPLDLTSIWTTSKPLRSPTKQHRNPPQTSSLMSTAHAHCQTHASRSNSDQDSSKGALLITPVALVQLEDLECPICHETYTEPRSTDQLSEPQQEWAVKVDMIAEWFGTKRCCGHIIGRKCLEKHLKGPGPWRNKCPLCRDVWFHEVAPRDAQPRAETPEPPSTTRAPRRSQRIAERRSASQRTSGSIRGVARTPSRQRPQRRPIRFTQRLMAALEVEDGTEEVKGTMEEVERRLNRLYEDATG